MLLCVDVGNTLTDLGLFDGDAMVNSFKTKSDVDRSLDEYQSVLALYIESRHLVVSKVDAAIISSVVPSLTRIWTTLIENVFGAKPLILGPKLKTGLAIVTDRPSEVGSDLIADAVGALLRYGPSCLIADLGTANKVLLLDKDSCFSGVTISPGLSLSMEALVRGTAALPKVSLIAPKNVIGRNTPDSMNSGIINGTAYAIRGFALAFEKECGYPLKRILTGGNAIYVKDVLSEFAYDEFLLLKGLRAIYARNRK